MKGITELPTKKLDPESWKFIIISLSLLLWLVVGFFLHFFLIKKCTILPPANFLLWGYFWVFTAGIRPRILKKGVTLYRQNPAISAESLAATVGELQVNAQLFLTQVETEAKNTMLGKKYPYRFLIPQVVVLGAQVVLFFWGLNVVQSGINAPDPAERFASIVTYFGILVSFPVHSIFIFIFQKFWSRFKQALRYVDFGRIVGLMFGLLMGALFYVLICVNIICINNIC